MSRATAHAKINLALVVGPRRRDGKHEVATVLQRIDLADELELDPAPSLLVVGFPDDTLVTAALEALAEAVGVPPAWRVHLEKRIPVAAGLGGGSSDAAAALRLANTTLPAPLSPAELEQIAATIGADVPFFLRSGTQLGTGDGTDLRALELPRGYHLLLVLSHGHTKRSTAGVYRAFDERGGERGFEDRRALLMEALESVRAPSDLARLPRNDLASSSPLVAELERLGAFRADVSGAGPTVYALFDDDDAAKRAAATLARTGRTWLTNPV